MKIMKVNPDVNIVFSAGNAKPEYPDSKKKSSKTEKIINYSVAAAASAAIIIGGIYYLKRHGKLKSGGSITDDARAKLNAGQKAEPPRQAVETSAQKPAAETKIPENLTQTPEPKKAEIKTNTENLKPENKKPFVLDEKYSDFTKIEGEKVEDDIIQQIENGIVRREFSSDDGKHVSFYSEFDDTGKRALDVEFRVDGTVKAVTKYANGEFSEISFYKKDGETLEKTFDNFENSVSFSLHFD